MPKYSRIDLYLQRGLGQRYVNTPQEQELVNKFVQLYAMAKSAHDSDEHCSPENLLKWRKAYNGTLNALDQDGVESKRKSRQLRKMCYEFVESKIDNSIPMPKMKARYKRDLPLVNITENYLKYEADNILTKYVNDESERSTYIDGTTWYKVWWDSFDNTHERSGNVKIEVCTADQIIPQPGVTDFRKLEYIFEIKSMSLSSIYDLYGRMIDPVTSTSNVIDVICCYYLNEDRIVGLFMWSKTSLQVICNEKDWQIRKIRKCTHCGTPNPEGSTCRLCGSKNFRYYNAEEEILEEDLYDVYNPYDVGETDNPDDNIRKEIFLSAGTSIPFYRVDRLPFVPRPAISSINSIYGKSEVEIVLDMQDAINKVLTKSVDKTLKSGAVVTKPDKIKIANTDETFKILGVRNSEEAQMVNAKQIVADTSQDILISKLLYESGKSTSGITESFQGAKDSTATSGKAKEYAALQTAGRIESLRVMKAAAFSGLYELIFKYLLAFSDESRSFVKVLPNGVEQEETWNKYMFLDKDKCGQIYYRDDFEFDSDPASTLSQSRVQMWQETQDKFISGTFGNASDPRTLELFWNVMNSLQYPLASTILAGIKDNSKHLPFELEQEVMNNPQILKTLIDMVDENSEKRGGARSNSGPKGNGFTHEANVEKTNIKNRDANKNKNSAFTPQSNSVSTIGGNLS